MFGDRPFPTEGVGNRTDRHSSSFGDINNSNTHKTTSFFVSRLVKAKRFSSCIVNRFLFCCQALTFWFFLAILMFIQSYETFRMIDANRSSSCRKYERRWTFSEKEMAEVFPLPARRRSRDERRCVSPRMIDVSSVSMGIGAFWSYFVESDNVFVFPQSRGTSSMKESGVFSCICFFFAREVAVLSTDRKSTRLNSSH